MSRAGREKNVGSQRSGPCEQGVVWDGPDARQHGVDPSSSPRVALPKNVHSPE